jgi:hypothetical protein
MKHTTVVLVIVMAMTERILLHPLKDMPGGSIEDAESSAFLTKHQSTGGTITKYYTLSQC